MKLIILIALLSLAAQVPVTADPISNGAGWVGAGLLGAVLSWLLLIHLPNKDKQLHSLLEQKDTQNFKLLTDKDTLLKDMLAREKEIILLLTKDHREALKDVAGHCEQEMAKLILGWRLQMEAFTAAIEDMAEKLDLLRFPSHSKGDMTT